MKTWYGGAPGKVANDAEGDVCSCLAGYSSYSELLFHINICILQYKTHHMYINALMKYQLRQGYMFRP